MTDRIQTLIAEMRATAEHLDSKVRELEAALAAEPTPPDESIKAAYEAGWHDGVDADVLKRTCADDYEKWRAAGPLAPPPQGRYATDEEFRESAHRVTEKHRRALETLAQSDAPPPQGEKP